MTFSKRVTSATLALFAPLLKRRPAPTTHAEGTEVEAGDLDSANWGEPVDPERERAEMLFAGTSVRHALPFRRPAITSDRPRARRERNVATATPAASQPSPAPSVAAAAVGRLLWERDGLPASSVQRQEGNPTGGLRLVQAGFEDASGNRIDQTTYFRSVAFGTLNWRRAPGRTVREIAEADFRVTLLGQTYGVRTLQISHKPSGEAGQGNYTTILHWGDLGADVFRLNLVGKHVRIYAPASAGSPFTLEVS